MAEVQWIKLATDVFDNKKIKQIEAMPEGDAILVVWFKLLILAGKTNDNGMVYFTEDIPYTEDMLSVEFSKPLPIVRLALNTFVRFGMIEIVDDVMKLSGWAKYQSIDGLEKIREQNRERQRRHRAKKKALETVPQLHCGSSNKEDDDIYSLFEGFDITREQIDDLMVRLREITNHLRCENEEDDKWRLFDEMSDLIGIATERKAKHIYAFLKKVIATTDFQRTEPDYKRWM